MYQQIDRVGPSFRRLPATLIDAMENLPSGFALLPALSNRTQWGKTTGLCDFTHRANTSSVESLTTHCNAFAEWPECFQIKLSSDLEWQTRLFTAMNYTR
jgi:hypothetical protein